MAVSIGKVASAEYYTSKVATERHDYYAGHGEAPGQWTGEFAKTLGLTGEVDAEAFGQVLQGLDPASGEKLKPRANRAVLGWDVTFSPPKSISTLWALAPPEVRAEIRDAHAAAVQAGLGYLERHACVARLGRDGVDRQLATGFCVAAFDHRTSREADPQLHTHAVIANVVQARDGRRAAPDGTLFYRHRNAADGVYQTALRSELSRRLAHLGVSWVERREVWEVAGVPAGLCRHWSKRRAQIERKLAERGTSGGRAAQAAALDTRRAKPDVAPEGQGLHDRFAAEAAAAGWTPGRVLGDALPDTSGTDRAADATRLPHAPGTGGEGPSDGEVVEWLVGPTGLTEKASSFGRRDVLAAAARRLDTPSTDAFGAWARLERIADQTLADPRVIPLLNSAGVTSGEVIRPRDEHGRILAQIATATERRYSTTDLLAAEYELLTRGRSRQTAGAAQVPAALVDAALAAHSDLDADQRRMICTLASSGAGVDVVVGKAGTGKTTALGAYRHLLDQAGIPLLGVAPSATAAHQLGQGAGIADTATVHKLLAELAHSGRCLASGQVVVLDEASMCSTRIRLALQQAVDAVGGKVVDVGDHRQIPSVDVGGAHHALASLLGAVTLGVNHRFRDTKVRDAAELVRDGDAPRAVELLHALGFVNEHDDPADAWVHMVNDWNTLRQAGAEVRMIATEHAVVDQLNTLARHTLIQNGDLPRKARRYISDDDTRDIVLAVGDRVRLGRNIYGLPQPHGTTITVCNGMTGTVTATTRPHITVRLDPDHRPTPDHKGDVILPAGYIGEHVAYAYALTADSAEGITVDHSLFAPSAASTAERAYIALSRGRESNRIYAATGSGWQEAIATDRHHTFASHQHPDVHPNPNTRSTPQPEHTPAPPPLTIQVPDPPDDRQTSTSTRMRPEEANRRPEPVIDASTDLPREDASAPQRSPRAASPGGADAPASSPDPIGDEDHHPGVEPPGLAM